MRTIPRKNFRICSHGQGSKSMPQPSSIGKLEQNTEKNSEKEIENRNNFKKEKKKIE